MSCGGGKGVGDAGFTPSPHRSFPVLPKDDGHVLSPLTLVTITASNDPDGDALQAFSDELIVSSWYGAVGAEYGVGPAAASLHRFGPAISADLTTAQVEQYIIDVADAGGPAVNGQTLYLAYLPAPYRVSDSGDCGYHKPFPDGGQTIGDGWAMVGHCTPFALGETPLQALTRIGSHEIIEGVTDSFHGWRFAGTPATPWSSSVWRAYAQGGSVEVADLCEGTRILLPGRDGGLLDYSRSWSNAAAVTGGDPCVPPHPDPYFNVSFPLDWYALDAGERAQLPMNGWSTAPRSNWLVRSYLRNGSANLLALGADAGFWSADSTLGSITLDAGCTARTGMNDGVIGALDVDMPAAAHSGDWAVFEVRSFEEDPNLCFPPPDRDAFHFNLVGVYVP
ncbi:MAG: hypothetical protein QM723_05525 [Myxococcaceae bacterium]